MSRFRRAASIGGLVLSVALLGAGCANAGNSTGEQDRFVHAGVPGDAEELAAFLRSTSSFDFEPYPTPKLMLADVDVAVHGTVLSVVPGAAEAGAEDRGLAIVEISVMDEFKSLEEQTVSVGLPRPNNVSVDVYRRSLPEGSKVMVFGYKVQEEIVKSGSSGQLIEPAPQGLFFVDADEKVIGVWGEGFPGANVPQIDDVPSMKEALGIRETSSGTAGE